MSKIKNEKGIYQQCSEWCQPSMDSYGTNVPQNDTLFSHTEEYFPSCHTEERSDVSIHKTGTQPLNSEEYQPSMDSHTAVAAQNDTLFSHTEEFSPSCHTEERSDVSIHKTGTQPLNSEEYQPSMDSHAAVAAQNDGVEEWSQNDGVEEWSQNDGVEEWSQNDGVEEWAQNDRVAESGRSMVEILGVLAVIGVLSVTAVSGYRYAMNKHQANDLLNEASKRAIMVAGLLSSNPDATQISLAFMNSSVTGGTFEDTATIEDDIIFLDVTGVDDAVCEHMKNTVADNGIMAINESCSTFAFYADMSAVDFVFDGDDLPCIGDNCSGSSSSATDSYFCSGNAVYNNNGYVTGCAYGCSNGQCLQSSSPSVYYFCTTSEIVYDSNNNYVTSCNCRGGITSDWHDLCFFCSGNLLYNYNGYVANCSYGCSNGQCLQGSSSSVYYFCSGSAVIDSNNNYVTSCNCSGGRTSDWRDLCI